MDKEVSRTQTMTADRRIELRRWSAEGLMGWETSLHPDFDDKWWVSFDKDSKATFHWMYKDWTPDSPDAPASQILSVIERMRELGWELVLDNEDAFDTDGPTYSAEFNWRGKGEFATYDAQADTFMEAVLEAGWATGVGR